MALAACPACAEDDKAPPLNLNAACESDVVRAVTVQGAAALVEAEHGSVAMVMFYGPGCSLSQAFFPTFLELSADFGAQGVKVFAFSTDECEKDVEDFLAPYETTFEPIELIPWKSGDLTAAFAGIGIVFQSPWTRPLFAVVGKDGVAAMQWEAAGEYDVPLIESVIQAELAM